MKKYKKEKHELYRQGVKEGYSIEQSWAMAKETVEIWQYFDEVERRGIR